MSLYKYFLLLEVFLAKTSVLLDGWFFFYLYYLKWFCSQLYIQESVAMQRKIQSTTLKYQQHLISDETSFPRIPWHPIPATSEWISQSSLCILFKIDK